MQKIKSSNPKITSEEFANRSNSLLRTKGLNFTFAFDSNTCRQITELKQKQKDPKSPLKLNAKMNSVDGEIASVTLPEVFFDNRECGKCYVLLPLLQFVQSLHKKKSRERKNLRLFFLKFSFVSQQTELSLNAWKNEATKLTKLPEHWFGVIRSASLEG